MVDLAVGLIGPQEIEHQLAHWDEDRSALFVGALSSLFVIALITVILRLAARRKQRLGLQWDDYLIVMAQVNSPRMSLRCPAKLTSSF